MIEFLGMSVRRAEYPVGTIVAFNHVEVEDADQVAIEGDDSQFPMCHGYLRNLSFSGWGNPQYDLECIEHQMIVREVPQRRLRKLNLLEQLAIASA